MLLVDEMKRDCSSAPNVYTYNLIIQMMCLTTNLEKEIALGEIGVSNSYESVKCDSMTLDQITDEAKKEYMTSKASIESTALTVHKYLNVIDEMKEIGNRKCRPNVYTYNLILKGFLGLVLDGNSFDHDFVVNNCIDIFSEMKEDPHNQPDMVTFSTIMRTLYFVASKSRCSKTIDLVVELYGQSKTLFIPNKVLSNIVVNTLSLRTCQGDADSASTMLSIIEDVLSFRIDG